MGLDRNLWRIQELERERDGARRELTYAHTAMRNALAELADGDEDAAAETLRQIVGDEEPMPNNMHRNEADPDGPDRPEMPDY